MKKDLVLRSAPRSVVAVYFEALDEIRTVIARTPRKAPAKVVALLHDQFPNYDWVGIYWVEGRDLVLGPWKGAAATEHTRIPIGTGVCGAAAASGRTQIVDDVSKDPRYLACFPSTKSEIVVPIRAGNRVIGEIDIDGKEPNAFDAADQEFLEAVAALLAMLWPALPEIPTVAQAV
jgi:GAF domain-containing protein